MSASVSSTSVNLPHQPLNQHQPVQGKKAAVFARCFMTVIGAVNLVASATFLFFSLASFATAIAGTATGVGAAAIPPAVVSGLLWGAMSLGAFTLAMYCFEPV